MNLRCARHLPACNRRRYALQLRPGRWPPPVSPPHPAPHPQVQVKVFFHASGDRAVEFAHLLKLYPDPETTGIAVGEALVEGKPVVSEREYRQKTNTKWPALICVDALKTQMPRAAFTQPPTIPRNCDTQATTILSPFHHAQPRPPPQATTRLSSETRATTCARDSQRLTGRVPDTEAGRHRRTRSGLADLRRCARTALPA